MLGLRVRWSRVAGYFVAGVLLCSVGYLGFAIYESIEFKVAWSDVNKAELRFQDNPSNRGKTLPMLVRNAYGSRHTMLVVPSVDRISEPVWIILDATPGDSINPAFMAPGDGRFALKCAYLGDLRRRVEIDPPIDKFLASRCH